jgi:predicted secreted protein
MMAPTRDRDTGPARRRRLRPIAAALAAGLPLAAPALAQPAPAPTVLHLTQTAETKVVRNLLRVELRVEETAPDALTVQAAINRRMAAALDQARRVLGVSVETGSYEVGEEEPQHGPAQWRGSQSLILSGSAADAVLKLAGELQAQGLVMSSMAYEVSPETVRGAEQDLTAEALAGLRERAASIADRLHLAVLGYRDLRVGNAETGAPPMPRFAAALAMPAPVAAAGEAVIRLSVEAEVLLGPPASKANP